jgi:hypothetical protein
MLVVVKASVYDFAQRGSSSWIESVLEFFSADDSNAEALMWCVRWRIFFLASAELRG